MNWTDLLVVCFCGSGLLLSIWCGETDLATTIGAGLVGYLGGKVL